MNSITVSSNSQEVSLKQIKPIPGYEGVYSISENGLVLSHARVSKKNQCKREKWLTGSLDAYGYLNVSLSLNGAKKKHKVHRLVAMTFIANAKNLPQVNHLNGVKTDNRVENLEWCTCAQNIQHAYKTGLMRTPKREHSPKSKLKEADILKIRAMFDETKNYSAVAKHFSVGSNAIRKIIQGETWRDPNTTYIVVAPHSNIGNTRLRETDIPLIRQMYSDLKNYCKVGRHFGVSSTTICSIINHKTWNHVK